MYLIGNKSARFMSGRKVLTFLFTRCAKVGELPQQHRKFTKVVFLGQYWAAFRISNEMLVKGKNLQLEIPTQQVESP